MIKLKHCLVTKVRRIACGKFIITVVTCKNIAKSTKSRAIWMYVHSMPRITFGCMALYFRKINRKIVLDAVISYALNVFTAILIRRKSMIIKNNKKFNEINCKTLIWKKYITLILKQFIKWNIKKDLSKKSFWGLFYHQLKASNVRTANSLEISQCFLHLLVINLLNYLFICSYSLKIMRMLSTSSNHLEWFKFIIQVLWHFYEKRYLYSHRSKKF